jgi:acyl dehydratase
MPLSHRAIGLRSACIEQVASTRWLMAYAASVGATSSVYLDTTTEDGIAAHPLFAVCLEWPALQALAEHQVVAGLSDAEVARNVHGSLDLHLFTPIEPDLPLRTTAEVIGIEQRGANAWQTVRVDITDDSGRLICRSFQGGVFLGVSVDGAPIGGADPPPWPAKTGEADAVSRVWPIEVPAGAAHVYSETSRIWNPAHTDARVAAAAGLPGLILHGTATLAMAVAKLVDSHVGGQPRRVRRIGCRFAGPVHYPSRLELQVEAAQPRCLWFRVLDAQGQSVVRSGFLEWA